MIEQANLASRQNDIGQIEFTKGSAENLPMLSDSSVDLIVAGLSISSYGGGALIL